MQAPVRRAALALSLTRPVAASSSPRLVRRMAGGGHGHKEYVGLEKTVRAYLPENHQIVYAVLGTYAAVIILSQIRGGSNKRAAIASTPAPEVPDYHTPIVKTSDIPSMETNPVEWEAFINSNSDNFQVWLENLDKA